MGNIIDKVVNFFDPEAGLKRERARTKQAQVRKYEGASIGRRTQDWLTQNNDANSEIDGSLEGLRARSRDLVRNNPWASRGIQVIQTNVVGKGIKTVYDASAKGTEKRINEIHKEWQLDPDQCDWNGRMTVPEMQRLIMRSVPEAGEILVRFHMVNEGMVPLKLELIEADFINRYQTKANRPGNRVISGIEVDSRGRRVGYHLYKRHPGENLTFQTTSGHSTDSVFVSSDFIHHIYRPDRPGQLRGVPWLSNIMIKLRDFDKYEDAQILKQQMSACLMGFIIDNDGGDLSTDQIDLLEKYEPAALQVLGPGQDFRESNPPKVDEFGPFSKMILRAVASGLGLTFEALTGDLSEVNFSSARMGWIEMHRNIESWREQMLIPQFLRPVAKSFLMAINLKGVNTKNVTFRFTSPKREMIDPTKEVPATIDAIRGGILTLNDAIRQSGMDPEVVLNEIQKTNKELDDREIILDSDARVRSKRGDTPRQEAVETSDE